MSYYEQCGSCINFDSDGDYSKGYCQYYRAYYWPTETCNNYRDRNYTSSCYITTVMCNLLGYDDNCDILNTLRNFRNNILQKDEKYSDILYEYDTVGPEIAKSLNDEFKDSKDMSFINKILNSYIAPVVSFIKDGNNEQAIRRYTHLTKALESYYGIDYNELKDNNYDFTKGGHGKVYTK